jgi:Rnl2 family RNA ligase
MSANNVFHKYDSIETSHQKKHIEAIHSRGYDVLQWCATEKIHGSNFSVIYANGELKYARRTDVLKKDEQFFSYKDAMTKHEDKFNQLFKHLVEERKATTVQLFGELHGGIYPNMKANHKAIQKGIYYTPNNEYIVFDILVDDKYLDVVDVEGLTEKFKIPCVARTHTGTLNDLLKLSPVFESNIYKLYGLEKVPNNYAEGYVFKPMNTLFMGTTRVIVKHKNPKFGEVKERSQRGAHIIAEKKVSDDEMKLLETASRYITKNRYDNVVSKYGDIHINKLIGLFVKDAFDDLLKDEPMTEKYRKSVCQAMTRDAHIMLKK